MCNKTAFIADRVLVETIDFYRRHTEIKASHGLQHALAVYNHALRAIQCHEPRLTAGLAMEIKVAALLHDVDDRKYFPKHIEEFENAIEIMGKALVPKCSFDSILDMIRLVSCSKNGNQVPAHIIDGSKYYLLIPRWSDRLEAVGKVGIVRAYQYNKEHGHLLSSSESPRARTREEVWQYASSGRFLAYQSSGGISKDMISHYYDKLLHIARPPKNLVQNPYLERMAEESSEELIELCIRFGKTGTVDEEFIEEIAASISMSL